MSSAFMGSVSMGAAAPGEPYVGPKPYDISDRLIFHGRDRECRDVSALWRGNRLLVLHGPSGVGKTSLVQAGVIPLFEQTADVLPVGRISNHWAQPPADPTRNPYDFALLSSWSPHESPTDLRKLSLREFLGRHNQKNRHGDPVPLLATIDQFEELFRDFPGRHHYLEEFIDHLADAIENVPSLRLLISIREEYLADLIPQETRLAGVSRARFRLLRLSREAALEAVTKPLVGTPRAFAPGVAEKLVDDLRTTEFTDQAGNKTRVTAEFVEPMQLQVVCAALWRMLPAGVQVITEDEIYRSGEIDRTVAEFCGQMVAEVAAQHRIPVLELHSWLQRTFITELGTRGTAYEGLSETSEMPNSVARALEARHILTSERRAGSLWYELQHDRLIEAIRQMPASVAQESVTEMDPAGYLRAAERALATGDITLAEKHAETALRACGNRDRDIPTRAQSEKFLGDIAMQGQRLWEAECRYRQAVEHFETLRDSSAVGRLLLSIGQLLRRQGSYADAADALLAALVKSPGGAGIEKELAGVLWSSGKTKAATAVFSSVAAVTTDAAQELVDRLQFELMNPEAVKNEYAKLVTLRPDIAKRADVRAAYALALVHLDAITEAVQLADAAERDAPGSGPVLVRVSGVAGAAGHPARAQELFRRAGDARNPALPAHQLAEIQRLLAGPPSEH
ncbi:MAG: hypothetical protein ACRDRX_06615 [Pseudonocardiaceae bacterium]